MEISQVRKQLKTTIDAARERAQRRRQHVSEAERSFATWLDGVAVPLARQLANALKVEGHAFTVFTPGGSLRLAAERGRDDYIELTLDTSGPAPEVVAHISTSRGSRVLAEERLVKPGASPDAIGEDDLLQFLLQGLIPWIER